MSGVFQLKGGDDPCVIIDPTGREFREYSCVYPITEIFNFPFEKYHKVEDGRWLFDFTPLREFLETHPVIPYVAVTIYAFGCYFGQKYFKNREPLNWRGAMAMWNLFLAVYSGLTVLHGLPAFHMFFSRSTRDLLCVNPGDVWGGSSELWTQLFVLSKFAELFDTLFIVVHKKPLIFLHWYHHITVLVFTWVAYTEKTPSALFFGPINASVHTVMYFYYYLMAIKRKPKWFNAIWITVFQLSQMVIGVTISLMSGYFFMTDEACAILPGTLIASFFMYGSYLYLFAEFFFNRYIKGNKNATFAGEKVNKYTSTTTKKKE